LSFKKRSLFLLKMMRSFVIVAAALQSAESARVNQGQPGGKGGSKSSSLPITPISDFKQNPDLGLSGSLMATPGNPITLRIEETHKALAYKHSHYNILREDGSKVARMRSKFNPVWSNCDWDLLPGDERLNGDDSFVPHMRSSKEAKHKRVLKGKGIMFPFNPTYFNKAYISTPNHKLAASQRDNDIYYTLTHLNPVSKHLQNFEEAHIRVSKGWCSNSGGGKRCRTAYLIHCTFLHMSCSIKNREGRPVGSINRVSHSLHISLERLVDATKDYVVTANEGDALLFAQVAGFMDLSHNMKRMQMLGWPWMVLPSAIEAGQGGAGGKGGAGPKR